MLHVVFRVLFSHWRRNPVQAATLILGIALATALWTGVQAINQHARSSYDQAAAALGGGGFDRLVARQGLIDTETYAALRRAGMDVSPVIDDRIGRGTARVRIIGFDPLTAPGGVAVSIDSELENPERAFGTDGVVFSHPTTALRLDPSTLPEIIETPRAAPGFIFADISTALHLTERADGFDYLLISGQKQELAEWIEANGEDLAIRENQAETEISGLTGSFHLNLTAFGLLSFAVGLFIVNGAIGLAIEQRRTSVRTLRALGAPLSTIVVALIVELFVFALAAGALGVILGYGIATVLLPDVAATLRGLYGAPVEGSLVLEAPWIVGGMLMAVFGTAIASVAAVYTIWSLPILAPARPRAWAMASSSRALWLVFGAGLCAAVALGAAVFGSGLLAGFTMLGGGMLATALCLPLILDRLVAAFERMTNAPIAKWFWADTRQQLRGLSLSIMALLLAMATNIGVGTMVSSFRVTFVDWLDQRLASELYVTASDANEATLLLEYLETRAEAVLPIWSADTQFLGRPGEVFSVADHETYRANWPMIADAPDVWEQIFDGSGALLNEQTARATETWPGDQLVIEGQIFTVAGVYSDYGNPTAQALIATDRFVSIFPDAPRLNYGIRTGEVDVQDFQSGLINDLGLLPTQFVDQQALKTTSLAIFERTFAVSGILSILTLGVAGFAILTALLTLATMRLPQLAPIWGLGLTRRRLAVLEFVRSVVLAAITGVLAIPVGLGLAWLLLEVINVEAFGWRLPMQLFPAQWLVLWLAALLAAALASLWPAWRLARLEPARLLQVFAHER